MKYTYLPKTSGIYTWTNLVNNKMYVGYCNNFSRRKGEHLSKLKHDKHWNLHLQSAFNLYGEENFVFEIIEECNREFLVALEHYWATILNVHDRNYGYNVATTNPEKVCRNKSKEERLAISKRMKGIPKK